MQGHIMSSIYTMFFYIFNLLFYLGKAHEEGRKAMESAWNIMELYFWDKDVGLYKVY